MSDESLRQDFDECVTLYKDFLKQLSADDRKSLGIAASRTNNASGKKSVKFTPEHHYYDSNEWYMPSKNDKEKVLTAGSNRNGGKNSTKSGGKSTSGGGINNGKWKSKISMLEKKVKNQKRQLLVFNTADKPGSNDEESDGSEKEYGNRKH